MKMEWYMIHTSFNLHLLLIIIQAAAQSSVSPSASTSSTMPDTSSKGTISSVSSSTTTQSSVGLSASTGYTMPDTSSEGTTSSIPSSTTTQSSVGSLATMPDTSSEVSTSSVLSSTTTQSSVGPSAITGTTMPDISSEGTTSSVLSSTTTQSSVGPSANTDTTIPDTSSEGTTSSIPSSTTTQSSVGSLATMPDTSSEVSTSSVPSSTTKQSSVGPSAITGTTMPDISSEGTTSSVLSSTTTQTSVGSLATMPDTSSEVSTSSVPSSTTTQSSVGPSVNTVTTMPYLAAEGTTSLFFSSTITAATTQSSVNLSVSTSTAMSDKSSEGSISSIPSSTTTQSSISPSASTGTTMPDTSSEGTTSSVLSSTTTQSSVGLSATTGTTMPDTSSEGTTSSVPSSTTTQSSVGPSASTDTTMPDTSSEGTTSSVPSSTTTQSIISPSASTGTTITYISSEGTTSLVLSSTSTATTTQLSGILLSSTCTTILDMSSEGTSSLVLKSATIHPSIYISPSTCTTKPDVSSEGIPFLVFTSALIQSSVEPSASIGITMPDISSEGSTSVLSSRKVTTTALVTTTQLPVIGDHCVNSFTCSHLNNSECINNSCLCRNGFYSMNNIACFQAAGNISRPVVRPEIRQLSSNKNQLVFYCDIDHVSDISIQYQVTWYRDTFETGSQLMSTTYIKYESSEIFRSRTYLSEALITLGMTIVCSISSIELNIATASEPYFVGFEMISNNSLKLQYSEEALVSIRLTVPFGCQRQNEECFLGVNMFYLETGADNCLLPVAAALSSCGVRISSWRWNQSYAVRLANKHGQNLHSISRTYNIRFRTDERFDHEFFRNYTLPRDIQVEATSNSSSLNGKECHAICDPHMQTFDGRYYENQKEGTYILYTNLKIPVQVQMRTNPCYGFREGPPFCPCGVAIAAGRDVFVVDRCSIPIKIYMPQCDEGILQGKIKSDGNIYQVHLPSGSWVTITSGISFNIYIYPSLSDHMSTSGLCGYLDSEIQNDFMLRNRTTVPENKFEDFNSNWLVKPEEDLFNTSNYLHLPGWPREDYFCICGEFQHGSVSRHDNCSPDSRKFCPESTLNDSLAADCSRKLSTNVRVSVQLDPSDFNVSQSRNDTTMPKRNFTEISANNECWSYLNSSLLFKRCSEVPDIVPESFANTCTKDALITKTMFWAATHLDNAQKKCIYQVTVNQPLPEQVIKDNNVTLNPDEPARNKTTNKTDVYTSELLQDLKDMACPMNCTDQGNCSKGQCICWKGYGGNDCSVDLNKAPDVYGIPNRGVCDLHETSCDHASILGSNFADSPNLSCRISLFQVKRTESRFNDSNSIILKAKWISFAEISCPIADVRSKRSVEFPDDLDTLAIGYRVAVGNNREIFGRNISLLILDSLCVDCIKAGFDIACTLKDGYNLVNRRCIKRKPPEEKPEPGSIILIISTVVGSVLAVIVIGVIFLYCRILKRRAKYRKERQETAYEDMQEMEDQRETYSNVDEVYDQITDLSDDYLTAQMTTHTADKSADGQGSYYNLGNTEKNVSEGHAYFQHSQLMNVRQELRNRDFYWRHQYAFPNAQ